jgi:UDP-N-acetyl-D-galactosamine dehydrogenase
MNEFALIFDRLGLDTRDVIEAADTKWNFLPFRPGLVGGHCIGVDPYYLTHRATLVGYHPQVILAGRRINDEMGRVVVDQVVKALIRQGHNVCDCTVTVLGLSFKENVPDIRNSRVIDVVRGLQDLGVCVQVHDPVVDPADAVFEHGVTLVEWDRLRVGECVILAVAHKSYVESGWHGIRTLLADGNTVVADVKSFLPRDEKPENVLLWRL